MLKGKNGLYILLPLVTVIWGAIIYKVVDAFSTDEATVADIIPVKESKFKTLEREEFSITSVARDPFLGTLYKKKTPVKKKKTTSVKQEVFWPQVQYKGLVSDKNSGASIFLVEINNAVQFYKKGQTFQELQLIKGNKDKITLKYQGSKKEFPISK